MRIRGFFCALLFGACFATATQAQELNEPVAVESVATPAQQRIPRLVIHETATPVKPATSPASDAAKPAVANVQTAQSAWKDAASTVKGTATPGSSSANPIIIPTSPSVQVFTEGIDTTGNPYYDQLVRQSAARNNVDPSLVFALMRQESGFHANALSNKGASGLMQLMPGTARRFGVQNIFDPAQNIEGGTKYLRFLLDMFNGDVKLALAGYNAGENAVVNYGYQVPPYRETQNYVKNISAKYTRNKTSAKPTKSAPAQPIAPEAMKAQGRLSNNY